MDINWGFWPSSGLIDAAISCITCVGQSAKLLSIQTSRHERGGPVKSPLLLFWEKAGRMHCSNFMHEKVLEKAPI
jgi:hypothetical protein